MNLWLNSFEFLIYHGLYSLTDGASASNHIQNTIASDTSGLINLCLDSIAALRTDPNLQGIHISVGLSNFALGAPKSMQVALERAFLRLAMDAGMDFALANPEKNTVPLAHDAKLVRDLSRVLDEGRVHLGESAEDAGYRQLDALMDLWSDPN